MALFSKNDEIMIPESLEEVENALTLINGPLTMKFNTLCNDIAAEANYIKNNRSNPFRRLFNVIDVKGKKLHFACNGYLDDDDQRKDFAAQSCQDYLMRRVHSWSNSIKLRYGNGPESNPWLWNYMEE